MLIEQDLSKYDGNSDRGREKSDRGGNITESLPPVAFKMEESA